MKFDTLINDLAKEKDWNVLYQAEEDTYRVTVSTPGDRFQDVYVTSGGQDDVPEAVRINALYMNNGDGTFSEVGVAAGVAGDGPAPVFHEERVAIGLDRDAARFEEPVLVLDLDRDTRVAVLLEK